MAWLLRRGTPCLVVAAALLAACAAQLATSTQATASAVQLAWTQQSSSGPAARSLASFAQAPFGAHVLFGGSVDGTESGVADTWVYGGAGKWQQEAPATSPSGRVGAALAYDPDLGETILFGGYAGGSATNDTWAWDGSTWKRIDTTQAPPARALSALAYDSQRHALVLFGGSALTTGSAGSDLLGDTWTFDGDWHQQSPSLSPSPRSWDALAFDAAAGTTVLYGGYDGAALGDTWEWDGTTWTELSPAHSPGARYQHSLAYYPDLNSGAVVTFGGADSTGSVVGETWSFDGTDWSQVAVGASPTARTEAVMAYQPAAHALTVFGGEDGTEPGAHLLGDTWDSVLQVPVLSISPSPVDFGTVNALDTAYRTATVSNSGTGTLQVSQVGISGADPQPFSITSDACTGAALTAGAACSLTLRYAYTQAQTCFDPCTAALYVIAADGSAQQVALVAVQTYPLLSKTPTTLDFGSVPVGSSSTLSDSVQNTGTGDLLISQIDSSSADFAVGSDCPMAPLPLAPGAGCHVQVTFTPSQLVLEGATITILDNEPPGYDFFTAQGTGVQTAVVLNAAAVTGVYGGAVDAKVTATTAAGAGISGLSISVALPNGVSASATTGAGGVAAFPGLSLGGLGTGTYASGLSASSAGDASHTAATASAALTVTPAPLTIAVAGSSREFGLPNPAFSVIATGLVSGDSLSGLGSPVFSTSATPASPVGDYAVTVSGLSSPNYAITYVPGTLHVLPATVRVGTVAITPAPPNTIVQFSDSVTLSVTPGTSSGAVPSGSVTFTVNGHQLPAVPVGPASPTAQTSVRLDQSVIPGMGSYAIDVGFTPADPDFAPATGSGTLNVAAEAVGLAYGGDFLVDEGQVPALTVSVSQPPGDSEFVDFGSVPVWVRFDISGAGVTQTGFAAVADASSWSSTGRGVASLTPTALPDGAYTVAVHLVSASGAPVSSLNPYVDGDGLRVGTAVSPINGSYTSGAGFIEDPSAGAGDPAGYFAFVGSSRSGVLAGGSMYSYRTSLEEGGVERDVDVWMSSTSVTAFGPAGKGAASLSGGCTLAYVDARTGAAYGTPAACSYTVTDSQATGSSPAQFAITITGADGSVLHSASGTPAGGTVRVHL